MFFVIIGSNMQILATNTAQLIYLFLKQAEHLGKQDDLECVATIWALHIANSHFDENNAITFRNTLLDTLDDSAWSFFNQDSSRRSVHIGFIMRMSREPGIMTWPYKIHKVDNLSHDDVEEATKLAIISTHTNPNPREREQIVQSALKALDELHAHLMNTLTPRVSTINTNNSSSSTGCAGLVLFVTLALFSIARL